MLEDATLSFKTYYIVESSYRYVLYMLFVYVYVCMCVCVFVSV